MSYPYLIDMDAMRQHIDISTHIKPQRLQAAIKKAQELDLKPFLGYSLYYDFLKYFEDNTLPAVAPQPYTDLYSGCLYTDSSGSAVRYEGLTPALVYLTFARFIETDAIHYTATGPVIKEQENAATLKPADINKLVQQQRSIANAHLNDAAQFLHNHQQLFPLWRYNSKNASSRQAGPRIRAVDRTDYNGYSTEIYNGYNLPLNTNQ